MNKLIQTFREPSTMKRNIFKQSVKSAIINVQRTFRVQPRSFCLISGAPRSGTTAMRFWLSKHRGIATFNESRMLVTAHGFLQEVSRFRHLKADEKIFVDMARQLVHGYYRRAGVLLGRSLLVDKEPLEPIAFPDKDYKTFLVNTRKILPETKFLFMIRDPIATVWSMTQEKWGYSLTDGEPQKLPVDEHIENWKACADLLIEYSADASAYICQFGRLVTEPERESSRIFDFLQVRRGEPFRPNPTDKIGFSDKERELIQRLARPQLDALRAHGITDLQ